MFKPQATQINISRSSHTFLRKKLTESWKLIVHIAIMLVLGMKKVLRYV